VKSPPVRISGARLIRPKARARRISTARVAQRGEAVLIHGGTARADEHAGAGEHAVDVPARVQGREGAGEVAGEATDLERQLVGACPIEQVVEGDAAGERLVEDRAAELVDADEQLGDEGRVAQGRQRAEAGDEGGAAVGVGEQLGVDDTGAGELAGLVVEDGPGRAEHLDTDAGRLLADELEAAEDGRAGATLHAASRDMPLGSYG
jgi:hypothetical protein